MDDSDREREEARADVRAEANTAIGTGLGIGAFGVASAALIGSVCPLCVVAAPALLGYGVFKRVQVARMQRKTCGEEAERQPEASEPPRAPHPIHEV